MQALASAANALLAVTSALGAGDVSCPAGIPTTTTPRGVTLGEACNEFLRAKARAGRSDRYLRALRVSLGSFSRGRFNLDLSQIGVADVEQWLDSQNWSNRTKDGYLSDVRTLFNFAVRRGLVTFNPAAAVETPVADAISVTVHTPEQVRAVLEFSRDWDLNLCRCLAVRYFTGLRSAEADRMRERHFLVGHIEVTGANSKTRQRRLAAIPPVLAAWLALGGCLDFGDRSNRWRWFTTALRAKTGIEWPHNVTRHSFCSYHLARWKNAALTAFEAGHAEGILFRHYRELVTPEAARAFFDCYPTGFTGPRYQPETLV